MEKEGATRESTSAGRGLAIYRARSGDSKAIVTLFICRVGQNRIYTP